MTRHSARHARFSQRRPARDLMIGINCLIRFSGLVRQTGCLLSRSERLLQSRSILRSRRLSREPTARARRTRSGTRKGHTPASTLDSGVVFAQVGRSLLLSVDLKEKKISILGSFTDEIQPFKKPGWGTRGGKVGVVRCVLGGATPRGLPFGADLNNNNNNSGGAALGGKCP